MQNREAQILKVVFFLIAAFIVYKLFIEEESMDTRLAKLAEAQKIEVANGDNKKASPNTSITLNQSQLDKMASLEAQGFIVFEFELSKVYLST